MRRDGIGEVKDRYACSWERFVFMMVGIQNMIQRCTCLDGTRRREELR